MGAAPPPEKSQKTRVIALFQFHNANPDELVKSQKVGFSVIPAKLVPAKAGSRNLVLSTSYKFPGLRFSPE
jgi:hypothetical protein